MYIHLRPSLGPGALVLVRAAETLTINGEAFDFSGVPDGAVLPAEAVASDYVTEPVTRRDGRLHIILRLPIGYDASAVARMPDVIDNPADGPIVLPE